MKIHKQSVFALAITFLMATLGILFGSQTAAAQQQQTTDKQSARSTATRPRIVQTSATAQTSAAPVKSVQVNASFETGEPQMRIRFPRHQSVPEAKIGFDRYARAIYLAGNASALGGRRIVSFKLPSFTPRR